MKLPLFISTLTLMLSATTVMANDLSSLSTSISSHGNTPLKLYVLDCGRIDARDLSLFNPNIKKGTFKALANPCYLIQHEKGLLLWDTGLSDQLYGLNNGIEVMDGAFNMSVVKTLASQLAEIKVKPTDINYLAFSHLHNDHTGNAKLFMDATWLMQEPEHAMAHSEHAKNYGYSPQDYILDKKVNITKLTGDHDVFGDGSVVIIATPGHSAGHQSLFVDLPKTGAVVLSGDLYHFKENRDNYAMPGWNNKKQTIHSFALVDNILDQTQAALWIHHDLDEFSAQQKSPYFYQ